MGGRDGEREREEIGGGREGEKESGERGDLETMVVSLLYLFSSGECDIGY